MRISDWSSDVCSSDLPAAEAAAPQIDMPPLEDAVSVEASVVKTEPAKAPVDPDAATLAATLLIALGGHAPGAADRKSVVEGKSVSVRVALGGRRIINKKTSKSLQHHKTLVKNK